MDIMKVVTNIKGGSPFFMPSSFQFKANNIATCQIRVVVFDHAVNPLSPAELQLQRIKLLQPFQ